MIKSSSATSIANDLEHIRLAYRARRIEHVLARLRQRQSHAAAPGGARRPAGRLEDDLLTELRSIRARLGALGPLARR